MSRKCHDLTGKVFGKLTVIARSPIKPGIRPKWICLCECGSFSEPYSADLKAGKTYSCGCMRTVNRFGKTPQGVEKARDSLRWSNFKSRSKSRGVPYTITFEEFVELTKKPCSYCGLMGEYSGIDRVDSSQGYHYANCASACLQCNWGKLDSSVVGFYAWVKRVFLHMNSILGD